MKVLIGGSRDWTDQAMIRKWIEGLPPMSTVIHGDYRGADRIAGAIAFELGHHEVKVPANWPYYDKPAGPLRNTAMLDLGPDQVWIFHPNIEKAKGSRDLREQARARGIRVTVIA
jgi:hypothetical protein